MTCHALPLPAPLDVGKLKYRRVRYQEDLLYVREEMAMGLLRACYQIFKEAAGIFWMENHFRFSGRDGWQGLLRLPCHWPSRAVLDSGDISPCSSLFTLARENLLSKNWPKMHMARIKSEEQPESEARQLVCAMINQDRSLKDIFFIIPEGFRNGDWTDYGGYEVGLWGETTLLNKIQKLDFLKITVIFEEGSYLAVENGVDSITRQGWDLICMPGTGNLSGDCWKRRRSGRLVRILGDEAV